MFSQRGTTVLPGAMFPIARTVPIVWDTLTPHPVVMAEETFAHRIVKALAPVGNTMLVGYGDWDDNLGPVFVLGYDLDTLAPVTLSGPHPSEAFDRIRVIDGAAYLPWTDPTGANHIGGYTTNETGAWTEVEIGPMIHTFDVIEFKGALLACGSIFNPENTNNGLGVVYRRNAAGRWVEVLRGHYTAPFARFYEFVVVDDGDTLIVQTVDVGPPRETFGSRGGRDWFSIPDAPDYKTSWVDIPPNPLPATGHGLAAQSYAIHDGWLWVGGTDGAVKRTRLP